jgi:hypothetical protein
MRGFMIGIALVAAPLPAGAERDLHVGVGGGGLWVAGDDPSWGGVGTVLLEYGRTHGFGVRLEGSWMKSPDYAFTGAVFLPRMYPLPASWETESYSEVVGGSLSLVWSDPIEKVGRSYLLLSGGPYMITNDDEGQAGWIVGPGFGVALGHKVSIGLELDFWVATFDDTNTFIMPVRLFVRM